MARRKSPRVSMNFFDRAVGVFNPSAAQRRYAARVSLANMARLYDGAGDTGGSDGWRSGMSGSAADAQIGAAAPELRERMRDLVRNNSLAAQAVQVLVNNLVGYGIRPRAMTGDKALDKQVNDLWAEWSESCDAHGHGGFQGLLSLAVREMIEGGDVFAVKRPQRRRALAPGSREVPLKIELMEADHLDTGRSSDVKDGARIRQGIEYDRSGRRSAYWLFPDHPGDTSHVFGRRTESVRVQSSMVAHLFERQRVQSRGVPWGTPAMLAMRDLGDWQVAEMARKKAEACLVGVVFGEDGDGTTSAGPAVEDASGNMIEEFSPGMIAYARNGKDIKFNSPGNAAGIREWNVVQMHIISAGFRVPYSLMTGDLREANFSSSRVGLNEFRRMIEGTQWHTIIPMFCARIWEWFIDAAYTAGLISAPRVKVEWGPPKFESVNPKQDAETDLIEVRAGFASIPQMVAKRGYDVQELFAEQKQTLDAADKLGLVLDSDPRRVSRVGQSQSEAPAGDENEGGSARPVTEDEGGDDA